jgi:hypothetical protein
MAALRASNVLHFSDHATSTTATKASDKRRAPRRRVLKGALAAYNDRHCTIECTVRDISASGARIQSNGTLNIPDTFELIIEIDGIEADCQVVWRKGHDIGVRFVGAPRRSTPKRSQSIAMSAPDRPISLRRRAKPTNVS